MAPNYPSFPPDFIAHLALQPVLVLALTALGWRRARIANFLGISLGTVRCYRLQISHATGLGTALEMAIATWRRHSEMLERLEQLAHA